MTQGDAVNYRDYRNVSGNSTVKFRPAAGTSIKIDVLHLFSSHTDIITSWHWNDFAAGQEYRPEYREGNINGTASSGRKRAETKLHLNNDMGLALRYEDYGTNSEAFGVASGIQVK